MASGGLSKPIGASIPVGFPQVVLETAAQDEQPRILAGVERVGHDRAWPETEPVRLVVIASAIPVKRSSWETCQFPL